MLTGLTSCLDALRKVSSKFMYTMERGLCRKTLNCLFILFKVLYVVITVIPKLLHLFTWTHMNFTKKLKFT